MRGPRKPSIGFWGWRLLVIDLEATGETKPVLSVRDTIDTCRQLSRHYAVKIELWLLQYIVESVASEKLRRESILKNKRLARIKVTVLIVASKSHRKTRVASTVTTVLKSSNHTFYI